MVSSKSLADGSRRVIGGKSSVRMPPTSLQSSRLAVSKQLTLDDIAGTNTCPPLPLAEAVCEAAEAAMGTGDSHLGFVEPICGFIQPYGLRGRVDLHLAGRACCVVC